MKRDDSGDCIHVDIAAFGELGFMQRVLTLAVILVSVRAVTVP